MLMMNKMKPTRFTKQRKCIYEAIKSTQCHPDANWVYKKVCKKIHNISLGTVYRNINTLCKEAKIKEVTIEHGITRYDGNLSNHYHIICTKCKSIKDVVNDNAPHINKLLEENLLKDNLYTDLTCDIVFKGICNECKDTN